MALRKEEPILLKQSKGGHACQGREGFTAERMIVLSLDAHVRVYRYSSQKEEQGQKHRDIE